MSRRGGLAGIAGALLLAATVLAHPVRAGEQITIFAAASLRDALDAAVDAYPLRADRIIVVSYASSGALARQIAAGAPAHLYISANPAWADWLVGEQALVEETAVPFLKNRLVLVQPADAADSLPADAGLAAALGDGRLGVADPDIAPAGAYARQALERLGVWSDLQGRLARFQDVRATLAWVARGELAAGIVYESDGLASGAVRIAGRFDPALHDPIVYVLGVVAANPTAEAAHFYQYLRSPLAGTIFARHGFLLD